MAAARTIFAQCTRGVPRFSETYGHRWTSSSSSTDSSANADPNDLRPLSRPLGVREKPSTKHQTKMERLKDVLTNDDAIREQRQHLVKEAVTKGYFHDLNATRRHGGKSWIAPKVLIREDRSLYLPDIAGKSLLDGSEKHTTTLCLGKVTLLSILSTKISEIQTQAFVSPTLSRYSPLPHHHNPSYPHRQPNPLLQHIQINLQLNPLKSLLFSNWLPFLSGLRKTIPEEEHERYLVSSGSSPTGNQNAHFEYIRDALGYNNDRVGYVYLVDPNLRIRWAGNADPTVEEVKSLEVCTGVLLGRLDKERGKA
ncbi:hypothetical protein GYMLUDRAFT_46932 [Collybiopsis luxurians FD-317 M1]|uniref:Uncharacterized protein n=1 Tax=Collybiopsis luxurians FD-317 M1 TaxID=944289 RepID=A0A0D0BNN7_9AGAR|nr:hypothetical protein GYMLUDRAFT_46932 [Collybiopsis luxurians FD-317 M1]